MTVKQYDDEGLRLFLGLSSHAPSSFFTALLPAMSDSIIPSSDTPAQKEMDPSDPLIAINSTTQGKPLHCGTIAIIGRPNVGKSTLLNALVGQKISITSRKAQTTRHPITGVRTSETAQYIFVDTPGFQTQHGGTLNRSLNRAVKATLATVDVVLYVVEAGYYGKDDHTVLQLLPGMHAKKNLPFPLFSGAANALPAAHSTDEVSDMASDTVSDALTTSDTSATAPTLTPTPAIFVLANKLDRMEHRSQLEAFSEHLASLYPFVECIPLCAKRPDHIQSLLNTIEHALPMRPPMYDSETLTEHSERFLASEILREKVFRHTGDELPYQTTVAIEKFIQEGRLRRIFATIFVERETHRAMIIGAKGSKLKEMNTEARKDMEQLFGGPVYLEVWIKVKKGTADQKIA